MGCHYTWGATALQSSSPPIREAWPPFPVIASSMVGGSRTAQEQAVPQADRLPGALQVTTGV